jgi:hypothetical protein
VAQTTPATDWFDAFPLETATQAATAICKSWEILISRPLNFNAKMTEPKLTKAIKIHVEQVTARAAGLLGMWAAENVIGVMDEAIGKVTEERRTDITYGWTDTQAGFQLVFEFKKLTRHAKSHAAYVGPSGMGRFVTGIYSKDQRAAAMVGMMIDSSSKVVPALIAAIESSASIAALKSVVVGGKVCKSPSALFSQAQFDTDHKRPPSHGTIRIAHLLLPFQR